MKKILYIVLFIFAFHWLSAQSYKQLVKFGDELFAKNDFYGAGIYYKQAYDMDSLDIALVWKYAECLRNYNDYANAEYYYNKVFYREGGKIYPLSPFYLAEMQKRNGKYKDAAKTYKSVTKLYSRKKKSYEYLKARQEMKSCQYALRVSKDTVGISISNLGDKLNSVHSDFSSFYLDSTLYFASLRSEQMGDKLQVYDKVYKARIYKGIRKEGIWETEGELDSMINSLHSNQANISISENGKTMYFSRCGDQGCKILSAHKTEKGWSAPEELGGGINSSGNNTQPMIVKLDGKEFLFFSSDRSGGEGKLDIWYSEFYEGRPGPPKNAGKNINSPDDEITPFYDALNQTLFFSSSWHEGLGGFDVFRSSGKPGSFGAPVNMGYPTNTSWNDLYYSYFPQEYIGFVTSNRLGSLYKEIPTCCNDIYIIEYPRPEENKDTIPYRSLEELNRYLPVTLYFHNDEPNPRSTDTLTKLNYLSTYDAYTAMIDKYKDEYSKGLKAEKAEKAKDDIDNLFMDYVDKGVADLQLFTRLLIEELNKGYQIQVTIKGFASPLAKTDYNVNLTRRRITSLINYLREYEGGIFVPYINGNAANGGKLEFVQIPFGEYTAATIVSDNFHDQQNSVYSRAAALERRIEIQSVERIQKDSLLAELRSDKENKDFGAVKEGDQLTARFIISNTGKSELIIDTLLLGCDCLKAEYSKAPIPPGGSTEVTIVFNTTGYEGKQVRSATIVSNGFPPNKRLVLTAEVF